MKILLICEDEYIGRRLLRCLDGAKDAIFVLSPHARDPIRYSRYVKKHNAFNFSLYSADVIHQLKTFAEYADKNAFDIVIPADVVSAKFLWHAHKLLRYARVFPISDSDTLDRLSNKWTFAQLLDQLSLPAPKTLLLTDKAQIDELALTFPLVVKPLNERGGHGIFVFHSKDNLSKYVECKKPYNQLPLIVQEFLIGEWVGCNILSYQGEIIISNVQRNHSDQEIEFIKNEKCLKVVSDIVGYTQYTGVANFDFIYNFKTDDFGILECNPRFWNSLYASKWWGVDFARLGIDLALHNVPLRVPEQCSCQNATFLSTGFLARQAIRKGVSWRTIRANVPGIWHTVKDPIPLGVDRLRSFGRTLGSDDGR